MAKFCGKCGTAIDTETGLCPSCDRDQLNKLKNTPEFCIYCGSVIDAGTGKCPGCSQKEADVLQAVSSEQHVGKQPVSEPLSETKPAPAPEIRTQSQVSGARTGTADAAPVHKTAKKKKSRALTVFITVLLSICLFITSLLSLVIFDVRNSVSEENTEKLLDDIKVSDLIDSTGVVSENDMDVFYRYVKVMFDVDMSESELDSFIEKSTAKSFVSEKFSSFVSDFFEGEAEISITKKELSTLIKRNSELIEDEFGVTLTSEEITSLVDWMFEKDKIEIITSADIKEEIPVLYHSVSIGLSYVTMTVLLVISAFIIVLMIINSFSQATCAVGIDCVILGAASSVMALFALIVTIWENLFGSSPVSILLGNAVKVNALPGVILLFVGTAILVVRGVIVRYRKKQAK